MRSFLKNYKKIITTAFLVVTMAAIGVSQAGIVPLGTTAADFAVLGGSTVTNTGSSTFIGNVGSFPTPAIVGITPAMVTGILYTTPGPVTALAQGQVHDTYFSLTTLTGATDLTGHVLGSAGYETLTAGVYDFSSSAQLTGTLTLSGPGDFVFRIVSTLGTDTGSKVLVTAGANAGNVYWQVGSSATLGTGTDFVGNILALASIGIDGGGTLNGRALANAAVTISSAEDISVPTTIPEPATLCLLGFGVLSMIRRKKSA